MYLECKDFLKLKLFILLYLVLQFLNILRDIFELGYIMATLTEDFYIFIKRK